MPRSFTLLLCVAALFWCAAAGFAQTVPATPKKLHVQPPKGGIVSYPVEQMPSGHYLSTNDMTKLLRTLDPGAYVLLDSANGVYRAQCGGHEIKLFRAQNLMMIDNDARAARPLAPSSRGQFFVPLSTVRAVLARFPGMLANFADFPAENITLPAAETPVPASVPASLAPAAPGLLFTPTPTPTPASTPTSPVKPAPDGFTPPDLTAIPRPFASAPTPPPVSIPTPASTPAAGLPPVPSRTPAGIAASAPTPSVVTVPDMQTPGLTPTPTPTPAPSPAEEAKAAEANALLETARKVSGRAALSKQELDANIRSAGQFLFQRRVIVLDPAQPTTVLATLKAPDLFTKNEPKKEESTALNQRPPIDPALAAGITFRIAERCRQLLSGNDSLQIVLTRESATESVTPEQRADRANLARAKGLICLRIDESPFVSLSGYRLFTVHSAVDPVGVQYAGRAVSPDALPPAVRYVPFQNASLELARVMDAELGRAGLLPAKDKFKIAPLFLLKRAAMPSAALSLGYATCPDDLARMQDSAFIDSAAAGLAHGLIAYDNWLKENGSEARP